MIATVGAGRAGGREEVAGLVPGTRGLVGLKNVLLRGALVTSVASAALGTRIASQSARGDIPVGTEAALETLRRLPGLSA